MRKSEALVLAAVPAKRQPTPEQIELIKRTVGNGLTDDELNLYLHFCEARGFDPLTKEVIPIKQGGRLSLQISIDGYRKRAQNTGKFDGQKGPFWCGKDGEWKDVWTEDAPPLAAKVVVYRKGQRRPCTGIAHYKEYALTTPVWQRLRAAMIAKCAESIAYRKAFPAELGGTYTREEMEQASSAPGSDPQLQELSEANAIELTQNTLRFEREEREFFEQSLRDINAWKTAKDVEDWAWYNGKTLWGMRREPIKGRLCKAIRDKAASLGVRAVHRMLAESEPLAPEGPEPEPEPELKLEPAWDPNKLVDPMTKSEFHPDEPFGWGKKYFDMPLRACPRKAMEWVLENTHDANARIKARAVIHWKNTRPEEEAVKPYVLNGEMPAWASEPTPAPDELVASLPLPWNPHEMVDPETGAIFRPDDLFGHGQRYGNVPLCELDPKFLKGVTKDYVEGDPQSEDAASKARATLRWMEEGRHALERETRKTSDQADETATAHGVRGPNDGLRMGPGKQAHRMRPQSRARKGRVGKVL